MFRKSNIPDPKEHAVLLKMLFSVGFIRVFGSKEHSEHGIEVSYLRKFWRLGNAHNCSFPESTSNYSSARISEAPRLEVDVFMLILKDELRTTKKLQLS